MAKELEKYKAEFAAVKKQIAAATEEIKKYEQSVGQTSQVRNQGCLELGLEIQRCKDDGHQGKSISDFESDSDVKACLKSIQEFQKQIEKEITRVAAIQKKDFAAATKRYRQLKADLRAECDKRDAKKNRKVLPIDAQSLPDLKTLLDKVEKFEDSGEFVRVDIFVPDSIADHKKELDKKLQNAISQTKDVKLSTFQQQMIQQGLDERRMKKNLALATKSFKELMAQCTAANDAIKERKSKQLLEHKVLAAKELKTLSELVDPYEQALKDDWLKSKIRGNRHAEDGIKAFQKMYTVGKSELKKIANVKID